MNTVSEKPKVSHYESIRAFHNYKYKFPQFSNSNWTRNYWIHYFIVPKLCKYLYQISRGHLVKKKRVFYFIKIYSPSNGKILSREKKYLILSEITLVYSNIIRDTFWRQRNYIYKNLAINTCFFLLKNVLLNVH